MTRKKRRLLLLGALLSLGVLAVIGVPVWSSRFVSSRLASFFGREASVSEVRYRLLPFEIEIRDLRIAGASPAAPPFAHVRRIVIAPALRPLWHRRAILSRLHVQGLVLRINAFPEGGDDIPQMRLGRGGSSGVRIGRLVIEDGEILVNHQRVPLDLDLPAFHGGLSAAGGGGLDGSVSFGPGVLRFGKGPVLPASTEMNLRIGGGQLTIVSAHLRAEKTDLAYSGQLRLAPRIRGELAVKGPLDLGVLDRHVMQTGLGIRGNGHYDGKVVVEGSRVRFEGRLTGTAGEFDGVAVARYAGQVVWDGGVRLRDLELSTLGGSGTVTLDIPQGGGPAHLSASMREVDVQGLVMRIFDIGAPGVGSAASGLVEIEWPRGRIRDLSGQLALDLISRPEGRTPLWGRFEWRAERGLQRVDKADLRTPSTEVRLQGRIERDHRTELAVDGESRDLAATDDLLLRLRGALGTPDAQLAGFSGSGSFHGHWRGSLRKPLFEGRFRGQDVGYLGVVWGRAEWAGSATRDEVRSHSLIVRNPGGELWLDGTMDTGFYGEQDRVDLSVRLENWPASPLLKALEWDLDVDAFLSGQATLKGRRSDPHGTVRISSRQGRYYGIPFESLALSSVLKGQVTEVPEGRARVGGGDVSFRGTMSEGGIYDGSAEATNIEISELLPKVRPSLRLGGKLSGSAVLQGTLERPRLSARITSSRLFLGDEGVGSLEATARGTGDGRVMLEALCRSPRVDVAMSGSVGADRPYPTTLGVSVRSTSLDPFIRAAFPRLPTTVGIVVSGTADLLGSLERPQELGVDAALSELLVLLPEYPVRNREPLRLAIRAGSLEVEDLDLSGEGTDLAVSGRASLWGEDPLDLTVRGAADLRVLSFLTRQLRGRGAASVAMTVKGRRDVPSVDGLLEVEDGALRLRGFPHGIEALRGRMRFNHETAHFSSLTGRMGGGTVEIEGQLSHSLGRLRSFDVKASGHGLALHYPEGLRSTVDADLRFLGDALRQVLTGRVEVKQALWTRRYDLASELLAEGRSFKESASLGSGLRYDIRVKAPGTLKIDNNLATLQARADLALQGSYGAPVVLGRAEVDRGRVYFQGNTYTIRHGTIDFLNPRKVDPLFDIEAETRIQSYRITLKMNGSLDRVYPTLSSDPYLNSVQILSLLAGADESTIASLDAAAHRELAQTKLAVTGAATLAAGKISEEVGLSREAERRLGLSRFSIDPSVVRGDVTNPTARLTVGKRVTPDLNILYSVDLRGTEERLVSLEYTLSDRLSLLLTRAEPGGFGFDLRLRQSR